MEKIVASIWVKLESLLMIKSSTQTLYKSRTIFIHDDYVKNDDGAASGF